MQILIALLVRVCLEVRLLRLIIQANLRVFLDKSRYSASFDHHIDGCVRVPARLTRPSHMLRLIRRKCGELQNALSTATNC